MKLVKQREIAGSCAASLEASVRLAGDLLTCPRKSLPIFTGVLSKDFRWQHRFKMMHMGKSFRSDDLNQGLLLAPSLHD
jgi:hypothetical protein